MPHRASDCVPASSLNRRTGRLLVAMTPHMEVLRYSILEANARPLFPLSGCQRLSQLLWWISRGARVSPVPMVKATRLVPCREPSPEPRPEEGAFAACASWARSRTANSLPGVRRASLFRFANRGCGTIG
ncbi:uncharacterized protein HMPREF1120_05300 [Exophiala dermatitidis NIH/UT8656]|uniref:Uncharacterized protein n=1 Tax=Exophiala dermatitidis (strain ATCC 34100 / CBS 525.76 / NIH/UT8656) TaxID=858893 RepID=H6C0L4_EXODN|nr:uncharacterized protein HMPREF1120_05300 [Exophiala dermatitidis NIH/UT8656]EHY57256.1 hypothetical protein HMPREF1120_05300 [Exophiala dermatitidis NIH/UT8656]